MKLQRWRTFRHSDYVVKWQIAKLCSVDIMPHQLYNLLVSKTFLFCIHASKHAISILLILSKKKSLTNCVLSGTDEVDRGDKKINVEIIKSKCFQEVHVHIYFLQIFQDCRVTPSIFKVGTAYGYSNTIH